MSAEFCIARLFYKEGTKIDWDLAKDTISKYADENLSEDGKTVELPNGMEMERDALNQHLEDLKIAVDGDHPEAHKESVGGLSMVLTGGWTWGDDPTGLYTSITNLNDIIDFEKIGFLFEVPNYLSMIEKILDIKEILPLLMNIDPELTKMVKERIKEDA